MKIYKQTYGGQCGSYALLNVLQRIGVNITEEEMLKYDEMWGIMDMRRTLIPKRIKRITLINSPIIVSNLLKRVPLLMKINGNNFDSVRNSPHINQFIKGNIGHWVCLIGEQGDLYKYVDQQGENFGDKGHGYVKKSDLLNRRISIYRIDI